MHDNAALLHRLFTALNKGDHATMASCYHQDAHFHDIAFDLDGKEAIHGMWRMICCNGIKVKIKSVEADDDAGRARIVDDYVFGASKGGRKAGKRVVNAIESRFQFDDGRIRSHEDHCDPREWARQALGSGPIGFLAGRFRFPRRFMANLKLKAFLKNPPKGC